MVEKNYAGAPEPSDRKMRIFRAKDARGMMEAGIMSVQFPDAVRSLVKQAAMHGLLHGDEVKILHSEPGFHLMHAWLKKDYPLSVHSHNADCLYWIVSGALKLGTELLRKGDGFFVPANAQYSYVPVGDNGVEVLEFRHVLSFDFQGRSREAFWTRAIETCKQNADAWKNAKSPLLKDSTGGVEHEQWAALSDRFWAALDRGDVEAALDCCLPEATVWHNFDRKQLSGAALEASYRGYINGTHERNVTLLRRDFFSDGFSQQHQLTLRSRPDAPRRAWSVCVLMRFRNGKIASIAEYLDRNGLFDPDLPAEANSPWYG
jgi:ketosteroid isomerase-like protein